MEIDLLDRNLYRGDPHPLYAWLRKNDPVHRDEKNGIWVLTKYADVVYVSKNPQIFCSGQGVRPKYDHQISIITMDEPRHGQIRGLINRGFTPRMISQLERRIREIVKDLIGAIAKKGKCDFVRDLAVDLPLRMIAEMLGIPPEDRDRLHGWSDTMIDVDGHMDDPDMLAKSAVAYGEFGSYLVSIFEERRKEPKDDLVSALVSAKEKGLLAPDEENLVQDEIIMFMTLLLVAGNETTRNALSGGMIALAENPDERAKLRAKPELMPSAVEEIVRWTSPVINFRRTATRDTELRGRKIREGDKILLVYASANRDEEEFEDAQRFKVDREPNYHVGFGIGNHFCLGANLARMELQTMMSELFRRLPDIDVAPGAVPVYQASPFVRGILSLPVVFTPERTRPA
ncbi:MAG: cytochrome P450 [Vicinamibacteria bacterium]